jgi:hypothetical protein
MLLLSKGGSVSGSAQAHDAGDGKVRDATRDEEAREAAAPHTADRSPTAEEEAAADANTLGPEVAEHEREMGKLGAEVKGEGQID